MPNGTFSDNQRGAVLTGGAIRMSDGEGCGFGTCHCSDGHWLTIVLPRTSKGIVEAIRVQFGGGAEMKEFLKTHEILKTD